MAVEFNLLSGASIDNELRLMYEILRSGQSYLGFSRGHETWGQGTLIRWKAASDPVQSWPNEIIGEAPGAEIFDDTHRMLNISNAGTTAVVMARFTYDPTDPAYASSPDYPIDNTDPRLHYLGEGAEGGISNGMSSIECIFINPKWTLLRNIDPTYEFLVNDLSDPNIHHKYYIFNYNKDMGNLLEVEYISEYEYPGLDIEVQLKYGDPGVLDVTLADVVPHTSDIRRRFNLNGEYFVTGIGQPFVDWFETDPNAKNATFFLLDKDGALLIDGIQFEETVITPEEKAFVFSYVVTDSSGTRKVHFKLTTKDNINDRQAVFKESLPVATHVSPVADNNPPGLPVSYVRSTDLHESIFDVVGLHQLSQNDIWMAYEIPGPYPEDPTDPNDPVGPAENPIYYDIYDQEQSIGNPDILSIDIVEIDQDATTGLTITKQYARSKDSSMAASIGMNLIMVDLELDGNTPTTEIYRQIFIAWNPKYYDIPTNTFIPCTDPDYSGRATFFNTIDHSLDMGTLFYLANKMPVYRGYITGNEKFKIIL